MKVLLASDFHMNLRQLSWLENKAPENDLVVIAGDLLQLAFTCGKDEQVAQVIPILERIRSKCPLILCSGNHDANANTPDGESYAAWAKDLESLDLLGDGCSFQTEHYRFSSYPWWNGPAARKAMTQQMKADQPDPSVYWIWIHHAPPRGARTAWTTHGNVGDPYLLKLIGQYRPAMVFSGHIHNAPFYAQGGWADQIGDTWSFNPGKQQGSIPTHIELDLEAQTASHSSFEGQETINLATPEPLEKT